MCLFTIILPDFIPSDIYGPGGTATKQVSRTLEVGLRRSVFDLRPHSRLLS